MNHDRLQLLILSTGRERKGKGKERRSGVSEGRGKGEGRGGRQTCKREVLGRLKIWCLIASHSWIMFGYYCEWCWLVLRENFHSYTHTSSSKKGSRTKIFGVILIVVKFNFLGRCSVIVVLLFVD